MRVERDVLPAFFSQIEFQQYEQGGAVIRLGFKPGLAKPDRNAQRHHARLMEQEAYIRREERVMVALDRLEAASGYFDEGDLRRCRLKLNQICREFFPHEALCGPDREAIQAALRAIKKKIDALA
jgi:hypothetical protein